MSTPPLKNAEPCTLVILGASGDLTKRLLMPTLYNLACDKLLPEEFAVVGMAMDDWDTAKFRQGMTETLPKFQTRATYDPVIGQKLIDRLHYIPGKFDDTAAYQRLEAFLKQIEATTPTRGNLIVYLATSPYFFGSISEKLAETGFVKRSSGWTRLIVEKPFGKSLQSARELNAILRKNWDESQIYRIDHYLGKETVQNLLAFRFSNALFEAVWNNRHIDHIQVTAAESVGVEGRGGYYDTAGVMRDMMQNHLLQVVSYIAMEKPPSFDAEEIRNAKVNVMKSVRVYSKAEVEKNCVRGQYGPGKQIDGKPAVGYREEDSVPKTSITETFAALRLFIDNERWKGVPFLIRSGKRLWKRGTELVVQFKKSASECFEGTKAAEQLDPNRLIFHVQPDQGIEFRFHAKTPGIQLSLQNVNMRFDYKEAFEAFRGTGYEILLHSAMRGDTTLFSRDDLVEAAWGIVQPIIDAWHEPPAFDFPNYAAGSWGPTAASELIEEMGNNRWFEVLNRESLNRIPLFAGAGPVLLNRIALILEPDQVAEGKLIVKKGELGQEMFILCRGVAEVTDENGTLIKRIEEGDYFGELSLLNAAPRLANVKAVTDCDVFVLHKSDFDKLLSDHPELAVHLREAAKRYKQ